LQSYAGIRAEHRKQLTRGKNCINIHASRIKTLSHHLLLVVKDFFIMFTKHSQFAVENGREPVAVPGLFALLLVFHCLTDFLAK
jgi:hypothetical protein